MALIKKQLKPTIPEYKGERSIAMLIKPDPFNLNKLIAKKQAKR